MMVYLGLAECDKYGAYYVPRLILVERNPDSLTFLLFCFSFRCFCLFIITHFSVHTAVAVKCSSVKFSAVKCISV